MINPKEQIKTAATFTGFLVIGIAVVYALKWCVKKGYFDTIGKWIMKSLDFVTDNVTKYVVKISGTPKSTPKKAAKKVAKKSTKKSPKKAPKVTP